MLLNDAKRVQVGDELRWHERDYVVIGLHVKPDAVAFHVQGPGGTTWVKHDEVEPLRLAAETAPREPAGSYAEIERRARQVPGIRATSPGPDEAVKPEA